MAFKVVLVNPNTLGTYRKAKTATANLGLSALSAYLKQHNACEVHIIDARYYAFEPALTAEKIISLNPSLVGFSLCVESCVEWSNAVLEKVKQRCSRVHITLGSYFPSMSPEKAFKSMPEVDTIVLGEGEVTLSELVKCLQSHSSFRSVKGLALKSVNDANHIIMNEQRGLVEDLDELPFPDRYLCNTDGSDSEAMLEGTRGCKFNCSFCAVRPFYGLSSGKNLRMRSAHNIVCEIQTLIKRFPYLKNFRFVDPDFLAPHTQSRALQFVEKMKEADLKIDLMMDTRSASIKKNKDLIKELKSVGLKRFYLGIESGSPHILHKMRKGIALEDNEDAIVILKELGIDYSYGFMMITPWSTEEDILLNVRLLERIGRIEFRSLFHELTLIPKTYAFELAAETTPLTWSGELFYYTYQTSSPKIERFRKLGKLLQGFNAVCFGFLPGYLYESIRQLWRNGFAVEAEFIEQRLDQLFLEIFWACWDHANQICASDSLDRKWCEALEQRFYPQLSDLLHNLEHSISPEQTQTKIPKYAPLQQI